MQFIRNKIQIDPNLDWLIATDLDGTLLDHFDYNHRAVDASLRRLETIAVPVIFNSSKTVPEMLALRKDCDNRHPFIVENGSAIYIPEHCMAQPMPSAASTTLENELYSIIQLGVDVEQIRQYLKKDGLETDSPLNKAPFISFSSATDQELIDATGLSPEAVTQARRRLYSEPLLWQGSEREKQNFIKRAQAAGLNTLQGGRFLHILGPCNKGKAIEALVAFYRHQWQRDYHVIAAGDSPNDVDMLTAADIAVLIRSPVHEFPSFEGDNTLIHSQQTGPSGWNEVISTLFGF